MINNTAHRLILALALVFGLFADPTAFVNSDLVRIAAVLITCDLGWGFYELVAYLRAAKPKQPITSS
jgi:hypothetical protein